MIMPPDSEHPSQQPEAPPPAEPAGRVDAPPPAAVDPALRFEERPAHAQAPIPRPEDPAAQAVGLEQPPELADGAEGPPPRATRIARFRAWRYAPIVEILGTVALALALAESVQAAVVKPFVIPSPSMEPTLLPGQRVLVNRLAYDFGGSPQRGDIVVFHPPASLVCKVNVPVIEPCPKSTTTPSTQYFVKRVMGLPGDHLEIAGGHPVINGKEIRHEPYITPCANSTSCDLPHVITVPPGEYYMLGDNRGDSDDSRYWGPVPKSWIIGEVFATYWPPDRIGIF